MQLGTFLHGELTNLLKTIEQTPPKRKPSLKRLKQLVESAPLAKQQRSRISQSLKTIQTALNRQTTPQKPRLKHLQQHLQNLQSKRQQLDTRLQELIVAVQRQQRMKRTKEDSAAQREEREELTAEYRRKRDKLEQIQKEAALASKMHRKQTVHALVRQYQQIAL